MNIFPFSFCKVTWDGDLIMLGADVLSSDVTENGAKHEFYLHLLSSNDPFWETKLSLITSLFEGQVRIDYSIFFIMLLTFTNNELQEQKSY